MVRRPSWRSGTDLETLQEVENWSGDPPGVLELVGRPSRTSGSGLKPSRISVTDRETLPEVRKWSGDTAGGLEVVGRPSRRS